MNHIIVAIATGFYSGRLPKAPGTWGSVAAFIPWFFFCRAPLPVYAGIVIAVFVIGFLTAGAAEKIFDKPDPGQIVIDEFVGMFITLTLCPPHPAAMLAAFLFFRIFDVLKPFPVCWFDDHLHGGIGIMLDDVMAGIYAFCCTQVVLVLLPHLF